MQKLVKHNLAEKKDWIVVDYSMETLAKLSQNDGQLRTELLLILTGLLADPHTSIVARARKLMAALEA